jgi:glycerol uptake facilitator-like aquaporin
MILRFYFLFKSNLDSVYYPFLRWKQALTPTEFHNTLGVTEVHKALTPTQGFGVEFFSTFTLVLVVFGVCDDNRKDVKGSAPLAIGLCIATAILATVSPIVYYAHTYNSSWFLILPVVRCLFRGIQCRLVTY